MLIIRASLLCVGLLLTWYSFARDDGPLIPRGKGEQCVAETSVMRRDHMDFLVHQRDRTVIKGIRKEPFSLVECVNCHARSDAAGNAIRIDAEGEFCQSCHAYVAVKIDCFGCHAAIPASEKRAHQQGNAEWQPQAHSLRALQTQLVEYLNDRN